MKKRRAKGFTLIEVIIVIIIVSIVLGSTLFMGTSYLKTMQVRNENQSFTSIYNQFAALARTSNYYSGQRYDRMSITILGSSISAVVDLTDGGSIFVGEENLEDVSLVFSGSDTGDSFNIDITPYQIGCEQIFSTALGTTLTGMDLQVVSSINDLVYCYSVSNTTCKLNKIRCE